MTIGHPRFFRHPQLWVGIAGGIAVAIIGSMYGLVPAVVGTLLGILASLFSLISLKWLVEGMIRGKTPPRVGVTRTILVNALKLPVVLGATYYAMTMTMPGPACFFAALLLVYFCAVWYVAKRS